MIRGSTYFPTGGVPAERERLPPLTFIDEVLDLLTVFFFFGIVVEIIALRPLFLAMRRGSRQRVP